MNYSFFFSIKKCFWLPSGKFSVQLYRQCHVTGQKSLIDCSLVVHLCPFLVGRMQICLMKILFCEWKVELLLSFPIGSREKTCVPTVPILPFLFLFPNLENIVSLFVCFAAYANVIKRQLLTCCSHCNKNFFKSSNVNSKSLRVVIAVSLLSLLLTAEWLGFYLRELTLWGAILCLNDMKWGNGNSRIEGCAVLYCIV